jgi:hypothetical protein
LSAAPAAGALHPVAFDVLAGAVEIADHEKHRFSRVRRGRGRRRRRTGSRSRGPSGPGCRTRPASR